MSCEARLGPSKPWNLCLLAVVLVSAVTVGCSPDQERSHHRRIGGRRIEPGQSAGQRLARPSSEEIRTDRVATAATSPVPEALPPAAANSGSPDQRATQVAAPRSPLESPPPAGGEPLVVVVLPERPTANAATGNGGAVKRTYHLVVTTDMHTATVAVDGRPAKPAHVQRIRSQSDAAASAPTAAAHPSSGQSLGLMPAARLAEPPMRRAPASRHATTVPSDAVLAPNGAPILD